MMQNNDLVVQSQKYVQEVQEMQVITAEDNLKAFDYLKDVNDLMKMIKNHYQPQIDAAHSAHKLSISARDEFLKPLEEAKAILNGKLSSYKREFDRIETVKTKELKDAADMAEKERLAKLAAIQAAAGKTGKSEKTLARIEQVDTAPPPVNKPILPQGQSFVESWSAEVFDISLVPRLYMLPDMPTLNFVARNTKGQAVIPGVKFFSKLTPKDSGRR